METTDLRLICRERPLPSFLPYSPELNPDELHDVVTGRLEAHPGIPARVRFHFNNEITRYASFAETMMRRLISTYAALPR
ncbi:MAG: hypothetical protein ABSC57_03080 [Syntrophales bacterium]|jgi:hypothetical protein